MKFLIFAILGICTLTCNAAIKIVGDVKDLKANKLYIKSTDKKRPFIDSVAVENGKFTYTHSDIKESLIVQMYYFDVKGTKWNFHFESLEKGQYLSQFILENDQFSIGGNQNYQTLNGGTDNRLFKILMDDSRPGKRKIYDDNGVIRDETFLSQNNKSTYLLQLLNGQRILMNLVDLKRQFNLFSNKIKSSDSGKEIQKYIIELTRITEERINDSFVFYGIDGKAVQLNQMLKGDKPTLFVFWASWCVPCRNEIPELKRFYEENKDKLNIVSLSIDKDLSRWKDAVKQEQMPWLNLGDSPSTIGTVEKRFLINSIPDMILVNSKGDKLTTDRNIPLSRISTYLNTETGRSK